MSKKTIEMLKDALEVFNLPTVRKYYTFVSSLANKELISCCCKEGPRFCECAICEEHRWKKVPSITSKNKAILNFDEWVECCKCRECDAHRKLENLLCYNCTTKRDLGAWFDDYRDSLCEAVLKIEAAKSRLENKLQSWIDKKKKAEDEEKGLKGENLEPLIYWGED